MSLICWILTFCATLFPLGAIGYYYLIGRRQYKLINGKLHIKEGISEWELLEAHIKREHPQS